MKSAVGIAIAIVTLCASAWASIPTPTQGLQVSINGNGTALGYNCMFWGGPWGDVSTSVFNAYPGSGTYVQPAYLTTQPIVFYAFVGLYGSYDGQSFAPGGVVLAVTPAAATDILARHLTFSQVFGGEDEQLFMDDIRIPQSGLTNGDWFNWYSAEGAIIPIGTQATLLDFSSATYAGTLQATAVPLPEPTGLGFAGFAAACCLLKRRRASLA